MKQNQFKLPTVQWQMANKLLTKNQTQKVKWIQVKMSFYRAEFIKKVEIQYAIGKKMDFP